MARVTPHTLFQAATLSEPVSTVGALWLVQQGKLSLDADVNGELRGWHLPDDSLTSKQKVTLRRLLGRNAGINVPNFPGYTRDGPLPTIEQTLDGMPPAVMGPVRVTIEPGTACIYSSGALAIVGHLIRDASGQSFEDFMREHVLIPAGMTESTFLQDLPAAYARHAATGTDRTGRALPGKWWLFPELAADGLWTTPTDLAKFALEIARSTRDSANHILSRASVKEMLTMQCRDHEAVGPPVDVGLGFDLGYEGDPEILWAAGGHGGFEGQLMMNPDAGWGYVAMGNSDNFGEINRAVLQTLSNRYGWGIRSDSSDLLENLTLIRTLRNTAAAMAYYKWAKSTMFAGIHHDVNTLYNFGRQLRTNKEFGNAILFLQ